MQDPEALGGVTHAGGVDHASSAPDDVFIAPETPEHELVTDLYLPLK